MLFGDRFLGASGHCPRNAAFMRQSGVRPNPCRINAAFRPKAALNLGAVPGCVPAFSARANSPAQSHPKPSQSHPEANAECRMENAEGWGKADQSQPQARYKPSASQEHGMHPLVFLLCCSCAALVLPPSLRRRRSVATAPVPYTDRFGSAVIQNEFAFSQLSLSPQLGFLKRRLNSEPLPVQSAP